MLNIVTKSKGWTSRKAVKIVCFVLIIAAGFVILNRSSASFNLARESGIGSAIIFENLADNRFFENRHMWQVIDAAWIIEHHGTREAIEAGEDFRWIITTDDEAQLWIGGQLVRIYSTDWVHSIDLSDPGFISPRDEVVRLQELNMRLDAVEREFIESRLAEFDHAVNTFINTPGLLYNIRTSAGGRHFHLANTAPDREFFWSQPVSHVSDQFGGSSIIMFAFEADFVDAWNSYYREIQVMYLTNFFAILAFILLGIICLAVLLVGAGRKFAVEGVVISRFNRVFLDIGLLAVVLWSVFVLFITLEVGYAAMRIQTHDFAANVVFVFMSAAALSPAVLWLVSLTERVKAGRFWRYTLVYFVCRKCFNSAKALWAGFHLTFRVAVIGVISFFVLISAGLSGFARLVGTVLFIAVIFTAVVVYFLLRYARKLYNLEQQAFEMAQGNYDEKIDVTGGELGSIAQSINEISAGIELAVAERMKSERLKTELITNVSHDIRTPLTSIITYTDLLKKEGLRCKKAPEYLEVLVQKSARLKTLTDELFEAAKAASGNINVNLTELDFVSLIRQVLGELDETIKNSGLDLRVNLPERLNVMADGKLMWRVMENLMSNVFKYALPGSRVYLEAKQTDFTACFELKNISAVELNVDPAELTERFKRGDDSRTDGGTGLGLSIVQSFVAAQGGKFEIHIDGDLFKVRVCVPVVEQI